MKKTTDYTILEWAQYMELIQAGVLEKLYMMIKVGELTEQQYISVIEHAEKYVKRRYPDLLLPNAIQSQ